MAEDIAYQSLYRKYRPQTPDEVIGQDHVIRALVGAVKEDRLSHAFLFCGPRGTGKTSTARILARMVNCEKGPTAEPCGVCEQCLRIKDGSHLDVVEIDAASHGGVDDARELRERAPTAPAMGREKVYIIDEAQRLSREAFDALLKVFEEPPPGVRFILATTEPHKMPATIVGRCQRFDFRRVSTDAVADHLERVAKEEGITLTRVAAETLARQSEGSVRDALSLLDQSSVLGGGEVTDETIASLIGAPSGDVQFELADAIAVHDTQGVFQLVHRLVQEGNDFRHLIGQVIGHFRDLLVVRSAPDQPEATDMPPEQHARMSAQAAKFTVGELSRILSLLIAAQTDMRWTTSPRLTLELALVRGTIPEADPNPAGLAARIERLERLAGLPMATGHEVGLPKSDGPEVGGTAPRGQSPPNPALRSTADHLKASASLPGSGATEASAPDSRGSTPTDGSPSGRVTEGESSDGEGRVAQAGVGWGLAGRSDPALAAGSEPLRRSDTGRPVEEEPAPHAPSTDALDLQGIRRSWQHVLDFLAEQRQSILRASLESVTPVAYEGSILELAFPPGRKFAVEKVRSKEAELRQALSHVFGISPQINCVARDAIPGDDIVIIEEDPPATKDDVVARLKAEFGAEVEED